MVEPDGRVVLGRSVIGEIQMINIGICDDEVKVAGRMENLLLEISDQEKIPINVDVFYSGNTLEKEILKGTKYDLIYLDIQMENGDGITAAKNIRKVDENVLFIFVSGYEKYALELFRLDVFEFIKKPFDDKIFGEVFLKANKKIVNKNFYYLFHYSGNEFKVPYSDIMYFESRGRKILIHMSNGEINSFNGKLSDIEKELSEGKVPFLRVHQSYLVNYHQIRSRNRKEVRLNDNSVLPISEERQKSFRREYGKLLGGEIDE